MRIYNISSVILITLFFITSCECEKDKHLTSEKDAIENLLDNYILANEKQDINLMQDIWAPLDNIIWIGTDSDERFIGWQEMQNALIDQFGYISNTYISSSNQTIRINCTSNTAWFSENLRYNYMYKDEAHSFEGLRFTGVLEKIDGTWKFVQAHLSIPAVVDIGD